MTRLRTTFSAILISLFLTQNLFGGTVSFGCPTQGATFEQLKYEVTIDSTGLSGFESVNIIIGSPDGLGLAFIYDASFLASTSFPPPPPADQGIYAALFPTGRDVGFGGVRFSPLPPWTAPLLIGTLTVDVSTLAQGQDVFIIIDAQLEESNFGVPFSVVHQNALEEPLSGEVLVPDDADSDQQSGVCDNCPAFSNPAQYDSDLDGVGDECDVCPGLDDKADCNANIQPDCLEIPACDPFVTPVCGDCNNNNIPDGCDITAMTSTDVNMDGRPDECTVWDNGGNMQTWGDANNWLNNTVPGMGLTLPVTLDNLVAAANVLLNIDVTISSLRILNGAILRLTDTDSTGDLVIQAPPGNLLLEGVGPVQSQLLIGPARTINVADTMTIGQAGLYQSDPLITTGNDGTLTTNELIITGSGDNIVPGGTMAMTQLMITRVISHVNVADDCPTPPCGQPPCLLIAGDSKLDINGNFSLVGNVEINHSSTNPICVGGSFINQSTVPDEFAVNHIVFDNPGDPCGGAAAEARQEARGKRQEITDSTEISMVLGGPRLLEVSGTDLGEASSGYVNNFAVTKLELAAGQTVILQDLFDNDGSGPGSDLEAQYVFTLVLGSGSILNLSGINLYYNTLINNGGIIIGSGTATGGVMPAPIAAEPPHDRRKNRYISFSPHSFDNTVAFRVTKTTAPTGSCWVQAPLQSGNDQYTARCGATPVFRVWNEPVVHVGDCEIIPVAIYAIAATSDGSVFSSSLTVGTILLPTLNLKQWGDVCGINNGPEWTPPNQFTNVNDVLALLAFISNAAIRPQFTVANLQAISSADSCLNAFVNTADVLISVRAISGDSYGPPNTGKIVDPNNCPGCP